jgi:hypothetical protein
MEDIVIISRDGSDLGRLRDLFNHAERTAQPIRFTVDEGTLKLKVGHGTWSPPLGHRDPECQAATPEDISAHYVRQYGYDPGPTKLNAAGWPEPIAADYHPEYGTQEATIRLPDTAPTAQAVNHPEPETQPGY